MMLKSLEALSRPATHSARASSTRCLTAELRKNRGASLLGLQAVALPDTPLSGSCSVEHGVLANDQRSRHVKGLH